MSVCLCICLFVCVSHFCDKRDTPQNLTQMMSELHETFSVFQDLSPELINNVHICACLSVYAQWIKTCTQLSAVIQPHQILLFTIKLSHWDLISIILNTHTIEMKRPGQYNNNSNILDSPVYIVSSFVEMRTQWTI